MNSRLHRAGRGVFALVCAVAVALAFAMPANAAPKCDIKGTDKGETIVGTDKAEVICGLGGNDVIYGKGGGDTVYGGSGDDELHGGTGADRLIGGRGADRLLGNRGDDTLHGGSGDDAIVGGAGADMARGGIGDDRLMGGPGDDRLVGLDGNDELDGQAGNDTVSGGSGDDTVRGGTGQDELYGGRGDDRLYGDAGEDRLYGGEGGDFLDGGLDGDRLDGGNGFDELRGWLGNDVLFGRAGDDELHGGPGNDTLHGDAGEDTLRGSRGRDVLYGGSQSDDIYGGPGADRLVGGDGQDRMYGLEGDDRLISDDGMRDVVRGGAGRDGCNEDAKDDLAGIEYVIGKGVFRNERVGRGGVTTIVRPREPTIGGIVSAVSRAPMVPDGDVAGAATDIVIDLDRSLDPDIAGRILPAGGTIRVTLPDAFRSSDLPTSDPVTCEASSRACDTGILVGVPSRSTDASDGLAYTVELEGKRTLVFTALADLGLGDMPGIKQIHLSLPGFTNPQAGDYIVEIEAETGPGGSVETGAAELTVYPSIRPSMDATSGFAASEGQPLPDIVHQRTTTGSAAPLPWDFLLWESGGVPAVGVELSQRDDSGGDILQDGRAIGRFTIDAPTGARGQSVSGEPSVLAEVPGSTDKAGRLTASFTAGDTPGLYVTTFALDGGNVQQMQVEVE